MAPRSALKPHRLELDGWDYGSPPLPFASSAQMLDSPRVHFPPTPTLTSIALTHSPHIYDRAPINVAPNSCALPERGARTYFSTESTVPPSAKESYFHPRCPVPIHSMQGWSGESQSLAFVARDLYNPSPSSPSSPSPFATKAHDYNSSSDSDASEKGGNSGSPASPTNMSATQLSLRLRTISSSSTSRGSYTADTIPPGQGYSDVVGAINVHQGALGTTFSLVPSGAKPKVKGVKKKLRDSRLQAGELSYRRATYDGAFGSTPDPALEGCLGGF